MSAVESDSIRYRKGYKYQLTEDAHFFMDLPFADVLEEDIHASWYSIYRNGHIIVANGYAWDGGTGAVDTPAMIYASLAHDVVCQAIAEGRIPKEPYRLYGDKMFKRLLKKAGAWGVRAWWCFRAVKRWGQITTPTQPKVYEAP